MSPWDEPLERATQAWMEWCRAVEETGVTALRNTITHDEIDLAEGVRYLGRLVRLTLGTSNENVDSHHPYFWRALGPDLKMGGDNPQGLYLAAPINGTDTYRVRGTRGSARWISFLVQRTPECFAAGETIFGDALFSPHLAVEPDGSFEIVVSPEAHAGERNRIRTDRWSALLLVRQFFGTPEDVRPMDLTIENLSNGHRPVEPLTLERALAQLGKAAGQYRLFVPIMQSELVNKASSKNSFATDVGDPTSNQGGVPGGNAVTARWCLEPDEALLVRVTPPTPCAYWDVQAGNGWYESWDYRNLFSGFTCEQAHANADGSVTIVVAHEDPGTVNWLEAAHHREGHIAIRWQLSEGKLPLPKCEVVKASDVQKRTGLPAVSAEQRLAERRKLRAAFDARFRP